MLLRDRVALITGASRGLGLAVARLYADRGARLVLTARGEPDLRAAAAELAARTEVLAAAGDVGDATHARRLVAAALERYGRVDVLVNNASVLGATPMPPLEAYPLDELEHVLHVNVLGPLALIQSALPGMRARGEGVVINVSSDAAAVAYPGWGGYGLSKAALEHLSRVLAAELAGTGIRVYAVDPGDMDTRMHREAEPHADLSHLPGPEVPAPAFVYLVEHEATPWGRFRAADLIAAATRAGAGGGRAGW